VGMAEHVGATAATSLDAVDQRAALHVKQIGRIGTRDRFTEHAAGSKQVVGDQRRHANPLPSLSLCFGSDDGRRPRPHTLWPFSSRLRNRTPSRPFSSIRALIESVPGVGFWSDRLPKSNTWFAPILVDELDATDSNWLQTLASFEQRNWVRFAKRDATDSYRFCFGGFRRRTLPPFSSMNSTPSGTSAGGFFR
jgi:hypothetical protein